MIGGGFRDAMMGEKAACLVKEKVCMRCAKSQKFASESEREREREGEENVAVEFKLRRIMHGGIWKCHRLYSEWLLAEG